MKIIIDALGFVNGKAYGFQEYLFNLLDYFYIHRAKITADKIIIACEKQQCQYFLKYSEKFEIIELNCNGYFKRFLAQHNLRLKISLTKEDIILFPCNYSSLKKVCKHVLVIHDLLYLRKQFFHKNLHNYLFRLQRHLYIPKSLKLADHIIAISNFTRKDIVTNFNIIDKKISVVYNYFNFDKYVKQTNIKEEKIHSFPYPYFLSVCSEAFHKNTIFLLKGFDIYYENETNKHLVIVGSIDEAANNYLDNMPVYIKEKIHILKKISNLQLANLYMNSAAYISTSLFEGLGMPIVEAMYFDKDVILSDIEIHREISFNRGFYFNPDSLSDLVKLMMEFDKYPSRKNFREQINTIFSQKNTSEKYMEILNALTCSNDNI